jgi:hypothetical protein
MERKDDSSVGSGASGYDKEVLSSKDINVGLRFGVELLRRKLIRAGERIHYWRDRALFFQAERDHYWGRNRD